MKYYVTHKKEANLPFVTAWIDLEQIIPRKHSKQRTHITSIYAL